MSFQCMILDIPMNRIVAAVCAWLLPVIQMNTKCSMAFLVYLEPAGTNMLRVARAGLDVVLATVILLRLLTSACQEGIFLVVM